MLPNEDPRWAYASAARWFASKGRGGVARRIEALDWYQEPTDDRPGVRSEIITVAYPDGGHEYYHLPVSYRKQPLAQALIAPADDPELGYAHDAAKDPQAIADLVHNLRKRVSNGSWSAVLPKGNLLNSSLEARPFTGEQSNTSIFLGDTALLKFFRRIVVGRNIDIQLHEALGRYRVHDTDDLYGWAVGDFKAIAGHKVHADLLMITQQLAVQGEGWSMAVEAAQHNQDFSENAAGIGRALAHIHMGLVQAFPPVILNGDSVADDMTTRLDQAIPIVEQLAEHRNFLVSLYDQLRGRKLPARRIHGDFHLGQTLLAPSGWHIVDFEGEPMKPLAERKLPDSVWRDVAGMVRSLDYAAAQTPENRITWRDAAAQSFIATYCSLTGEPQHSDLLQAYIADKAIYEAVYESRNRPDWLHIPLHAIKALHPADSISPNSISSSTISDRG